MRARHRLRGFAIVVAGLLGCAAVAAWLLPGRIDPARLRETVERAAAERLAATVAIDGAVRLALLPRPVLTASRVSILHGAPGDPDALAVTAERLTVRLDLAALARGRLTAADLVLDGAEVQAPFPFDVRVLTAARRASLRSTTILLHGSRILIGPLVAEQVDGQLAADRLTGDVTLSGTFRRPSGTAWRGSLRLTRPGGDGSAALDATLDELYSADGLSATLSGQLAGNGDLTGRVRASGPSLGHLLPAPAVPFEVTGRATLAGGAASLEDGALTLDAVPSRLDATLRFATSPRLDLRLAASRLDLDAWRRAIATAPGRSLPELPTGLELAAESASLGGGQLRQLRADLALDGGRLVLHAAEAVVPGGMAVQATGTINLVRDPAAPLTVATSRLDWRLDGADLPATAAWLSGLAGLSSALPVPPDVRSLTGRATVETSGAELEAHDVAASLDGIGLHGEAVLSWPTRGSSGRASGAATVSLDRLDVGRWLAWWRAGGASRSWPALDGQVTLTTPQASWPGLDPAALSAEITAQAGALEVRRLTAAAPGWHVEARGRRSAEGRWSSVAARLAADRATRLAAVLPPGWGHILAARPALSAQPLRVEAQGGGTLAAPSGAMAADLGDLHVEATARQAVGEAATEAAATTPGRFGGTVSLRHPSARALAELLGSPAGFLGEGGLAATADLQVDGATLTATNLRLRAGALDAGGALALELSGAEPALTGRIEAASLPLPDLPWRSTTPLPLSLLHGWHAALDLHAARADGPGIRLADLATRVSLEGGTLELADLSASPPGGGRLTGRLGFAAEALPPRATADLAFEGVRLGAQPWHPLGLLASGISGTAKLEAQGFAPAALLATLQGEMRATSPSASLVGVDVGGLGGALSDAAVRTALGGGRTLLDRLTVGLTVEQGLARLRAEGVASDGARLLGSGTIDLPETTVDLDLSVTPPITDPPVIRWRLSGPAGHAVATPALGGLAEWRAAHP